MAGSTPGSPGVSGGELILYPTFGTVTQKDGHLSTPRRGRSKPEQQPSATEPNVSGRDRLIPTLARVFRRYGYEAASLSVLSSATGLNRSSLYHFFPGGKEEMAMAVLSFAEEFVREDLMATLTAPSPQKAQLERFIGKLHDYYEGGSLGCLYSTLTLHDCPEAVAARVAALTEEWIAAIASYLASQRVKDPRPRAEKFMRLLQGGLVVALATQDPARFEAALDDLKPVLSGGRS
jgi:AcrR family transcriptional regulator